MDWSGYAPILLNNVVQFVELTETTVSKAGGNFDAID